MRILLSIFLLIITFSFGQSQTIDDAVRYSEIMPLGSARSVGVGSSFGAMGGDFSVISINLSLHGSLQTLLLGSQSQRVSSEHMLIVVLRNMDFYRDSTIL